MEDKSQKSPSNGFGAAPQENICSMIKFCRTSKAQDQHSEHSYISPYDARVSFFVVLCCMHGKSACTNMTFNV